jgi:diguanylate cyclase (GGDEF)-like protein
MALRGSTVAAGAIVVAQAVAIRRLSRRAADSEHQALHDVLTGLPNRALFRDRVERALSAARRDGSHPAVMLLDLDDFKRVNDTYGHDVGDALLRQVGPRVAAVLRDSDTIARLGGDEFAVLLPAGGDAFEVAAKIRRALAVPFCVDGIELTARASVGFAVHPWDGDDVDALLRQADLAMYAAKGRQLVLHP